MSAGAARRKMKELEKETIRNAKGESVIVTLRKYIVTLINPGEVGEEELKNLVLVGRSIEGRKDHGYELKKRFYRIPWTRSLHMR